MKIENTVGSSQVSTDLKFKVENKNVIFLFVRLKQNSELIWFSFIIEKQNFNKTKSCLSSRQLKEPDNSKMVKLEMKIENTFL